MHDVEEDITQSQDLSTRSSSAYIELAQMKSFIHKLQHRSNADAAWFLVPTRVGDDIAELVDVESMGSLG